MNTIKTSLFALAVLSTHAFVYANCGCGGFPLPLPPTLPAPLPLPLPLPAPLPLPLPLPAPPCAFPAPAPLPLPLPVPAPPCAKPEPKPKVYINKQAPIVINRKAQSYVVNAGAPVIIKPAPVVIQRPGHSEFRPIVQTVTSAPIIVDKKIIKIERPIVKKFYQEAFSQTLPSECGHTIPLKPVLPPPCNNLPVAPLPLAPLPAPLPVVPPFPAAALPEPIAIQPVESVPAEISALLAGVSPPAASPCGCPLI